MLPIEGQPILTAAQMRAAEARAAPTRDAMYALMERAGAGVAEAVRRLAAGAEALILCGPGNNGGDGYVAARILLEAGHPVRVAALGEPATDLARRARQGWTGPVEGLEGAVPAEMLVDALFGTGLARPLAPDVDAALARLLARSRFAIAVDVPSGVDADTGDLPWRSDPLQPDRRQAGYLRPHGRAFDLTLALGAAKSAHVLQPATAPCGAVRLIDIGLPAPERAMPYHLLDPLWGNDHVMARPALAPPGPTDHKYTRGMVAVVAGVMEGAARLAAIASLRAGAGYAALFGGSGQGGPDALVHRAWSADALCDPRIGAIVVGPGLGRNAIARERLAAVLATDTASVVVDGDALHLLDAGSLHGRQRRAVLTPHEGEFQAMFPDLTGSPVERARAAATQTGAIVVLKGSTTVIADSYHAIVKPGGNPWLSTAGTGDVLAGTIGALVARSGDIHPLDEVAAGVWLHAEAARRCRASFIADDLAHALTAARASL